VKSHCSVILWLGNYKAQDKTEKITI